MTAPKKSKDTSKAQKAAPSKAKKATKEAEESAEMPAVKKTSRTTKKAQEPAVAEKKTPAKKPAAKAKEEKVPAPVVEKEVKPKKTASKPKAQEVEPEKAPKAKVSKSVKKAESTTPAAPKVSAKAASSSKAKPAPVKVSASKQAAPASQEEEAANVLREQLMKDKEWQQFLVTQRSHLEDLRDGIMEMMGTIQKDALGSHPEGSEASGSGEHTADAGSDAYDRELALGFLSNEQDSLLEINQALERMKRGYYGICEMSGKLIPRLRLEALPFARLTVECQAQWEKEYGTKSKFRSRGGFGYSGGVIETENTSVSLDEEEE